MDAGAGGELGIIVASNPKVCSSYARILRYLDCIQHYKKLNEIQNNFVVISEEGFIDILTEYGGGAV